MEIWRVLKCTKCGKIDGLYYAPSLSEDEELRKCEIEEYESDFEVNVTKDGRFEKTCTCGGTIKQVDRSKWPLKSILEIIGNLIEDDNHHSLVRLGHTFNECMKEAGISKKKRRDALRNYLTQYEETRHICGKQ